MRKVLREGTWIRLSQGELYKITGTPVGEGGGSIVYPCKKISHFNGKITVSEIDYALKECFPLSSAFVLSAGKMVRSYLRQKIRQQSVILILSEKCRCRSRK